MPAYTGRIVDPDAIVKMIQANDEGVLVTAIIENPVETLKTLYELAFKLLEAQSEITHLRATRTTPEDVANFVKALSGGYKTGLEATPANIRNRSQF